MNLDEKYHISELSELEICHAKMSITQALLKQTIVQGSVIAVKWEEWHCRGMHRMSQKAKQHLPLGNSKEGWLEMGKLEEKHYNCFC